MLFEEEMLDWSGNDWKPLGAARRCMKGSVESETGAESVVS